MKHVFLVDSRGRRTQVLRKDGAPVVVASVAEARRVAFLSVGDDLNVETEEVDEHARANEDA